MNQSLRLLAPTALIAALGMLGWWGLGSSSQATEQPRVVVTVPPHVHWEYHLVAYHPILENMEKELNKMGEEGWEVAGVSNGAIQQVILKRPRR